VVGESNHRDHWLAITTELSRDMIVVVEIITGQPPRQDKDVNLQLCLKQAKAYLVALHLETVNGKQ
jgi:hypothetical protein